MHAPRRTDERDACGIGFVASADASASRAIVDSALEALSRVKHRGAVASDSLTGDGAGVLLPIPHTILASEGWPEAAALCMTFLDPSDPATGRSAVEEACALEGLDVAGWRRVPSDEGALGESARRSQPLIEQAVVTGAGLDNRAAFRARRRAESTARHNDLRLYVASFSFDTVTYKALCAADQLAAFYGDLADDRYEGWFALFHQRYSTNTAPTWERAQPMRLLGHNGEINTIRGNVAWMHGREGDLGGPAAPDDLLRPAVDERGSDSAILDEALELVRFNDRDLVHAATVLVPPAWEQDWRLDESTRAFYRYHSLAAEPWDGPAAIVMADGKQVVARLDRNGLRPMRIAVCEDGFVACASEAGAVPTAGHGAVRRLRLGPGESFVVDSERGVSVDGVIVRRLAHAHPYGRWVHDTVLRAAGPRPLTDAAASLAARQVAAGFTKEDVTVVIRPMANEGHEPTSSMGDDTPVPSLARVPRGVFSYLKQRFAQVTNPPIDHLRERHVMSLTTRLGPRPSLVGWGRPAHPITEYPTPVLYPSQVDDLTGDETLVVDATFAPTESHGLAARCRELAAAATGGVTRGASVIVVSHAQWGPDRALIPSALAAGAIHHALLEAGLRMRAGLVVDALDVRESHDVACLITNGADLVCPRLALELIADLSINGRLGDADADTGQSNYVHALEDGLLKIMSKMGIATVDGYRGAQIIESAGLAPEVVDLCFPGVASVLGGASFSDLEHDVLERHRSALADKPLVVHTGFVKFRRGGELHGFNPDVVDALHVVSGVAAADAEAPPAQPDEPDGDEMAAAHALQRAVRGDKDAYSKFVTLTTDRAPSQPRDLLEPASSGDAVPLDEVEPVEAIVRRFSTGAMSHGALSAEAHETLSLALNMVGGMANTGEGGEAPERYTDDRNSGIKQVASGRFGVTPRYLAFARELQIKMAQGSKPGEGGQLPGKKVTAEIARLRHTVPGVALISPPPHHDIYSIEDLAQLIFDLKQANKDAKVSVKLVSSEGVGTIAAGVVKGLADVVHVSGADGGTGASPLGSIKNAGMPWEIGLAETQATLVANGLRGRARLRVDGGFKTGRDILIAALLGADEFSFGTAALIAEGCILVRTCHRDTCPVGIATQNPALRAKFTGTPEMVAQYLLLVAGHVRELLAEIGLRSLDEAIGRVDLLRVKRLGEQRVDRLGVGALLADPGEGDRRFTGSIDLQDPRSPLGDRLHDDASAAVTQGRDIELSYEITTADRAVGTRLACAVAKALPLPEDRGRAVVHLSGDAGQSFGAWLDDGVELYLTGQANDYVGKGMGGGRIVVRPPADDAGDPWLVGNTVLYGATGGQLFVAGRAGERFAVRNSGAVAVVEGTGDHACEYMTAGAVVVLGATGVNFGAGMSGGEAYVWDENDTLSARINPQLVAAYEPTEGQLESLRRVLLRHQSLTGSARAWDMLQRWEHARGLFKRVAPVAEVARLEAMFEGTSDQAEPEVAEDDGTAA